MNKEKIIKPFAKVTDLISFIENSKRFTEKISLDKMSYLANLFDNPHKSLNFIHVTGTNGKGSTVAYLRTIYQLNGLKVASFTSPYVVNFNERIWFDGNNISDDDLLSIGNQIIMMYPTIISDGYEVPSFFEFITLLAFIYFGKVKPDLVVLEVGMGGRLDATNIVTPIVSIITSVGLDHMKILGDSKEAICVEKLGIVKENSFLITGVKEHSLLKIMEEDVSKKHSKLITPLYQSLVIKQLNDSFQVFDYDDKKDVKIRLLGLHQVENALCAIECVKLINNLPKYKSNFYVSDEILYEGLYKTFWPGRLEKLCDKPLIYIDGGHNICCIERVVEFLKTIRFKQIRVVMAISSDKQTHEMIKLVESVASEIIFTQFSYHRHSDAKDLFEQSDFASKVLIEDLDEAIDYVFKHEFEFTIFLGSLYLVSDVRAKILK